RALAEAGSARAVPRRDVLVIPRLGITLGDPAGVGAEVVLKALIARPRPACDAVVIGDLETLRETAVRLRIPWGLAAIDEADLTSRSPTRRVGARSARKVVPVIAGPPLGARARRPGRPTLEGGAASYRWIETAVRLARAGALSAIVTAPINKASV